MSNYLSLEAEARSHFTPPERLRELVKINPTLSILVAANPGTPPDVLAQLAMTSDRCVLKAIAANPNTPMESLMRLGCEFPEELLANPIVELLLLENPNFIGEMLEETLTALLKVRTVPEYMMKLASKRKEEDILLALANNAFCPKGILETLKLAEYESVQEAAKLHVIWGEETAPELVGDPEKVLSPFLPKTYFTHYFDNEILLGRLEAIPPFMMGCGSSEYIRSIMEPTGLKKNQSLLLSQTVFSTHVRRCLARNSNTPVTFLETLAGDSDFEVRGYVAENSNTPQKILEILVTDSDSSIRASVAANSNTPQKILETLATDSDSSIRANVAANSNAPQRVLETLAKDSDSWVRSHVAKNSKASQKVLETLATDSDSYVRSYIAANSNTPVKILETLAGNSYSERRSLAINPNTPVTVLETLAGDDDSIVRLDVAKNSKTPVKVLETLAGDAESSVRSNIAKNSKTPVAILEILAGDADSYVRGCVAENLNTPQRILEILAGDAKSYVRGCVAKNSNTPQRVLETLANDDDSSVRARVAGNSTTPVKVLETLALDINSDFDLLIAQNPTAPVSVLETLASKSTDRCSSLVLLKLIDHLLNKEITSVESNQEYLTTYILPLALKNSLDCSFSRLVVLLHPQTAAETLRDYYKSLLWKDRYACAIHRNTPPGCLKYLRGDANRFVRAAARGNQS